MGILLIRLLAYKVKETNEVYISTDDLKQYIINKYDKVKPYKGEALYVSPESRVYFKKGRDDFPSGTYVYSDERGYHIEYIGDKGGIVDKYDSDSFLEINFRICNELITSIAFKFCVDNREPGKDGRRILFKKELELLSIIGEEYYQMGNERINNILQENPYDDDLLG